MSWPFAIRRVVGHSMMPVLPPGTLVVGWRWFLRLRQNNVIMFSHEAKEKIKRIESIEQDGTITVTGDHSSASTDSRQFGPIDRNSVVAKIIYPRTKVRVLADSDLPNDGV